VSGRQRLPGGEPRKASQRNTRRAAPIVIRLGPTWRAGDRVRWLGLAGVFRRDLDDGEHAEIAIGERVYRVRAKELAGEPLLSACTPSPESTFRLCIKPPNHPYPRCSIWHRSGSSERFQLFAACR
jgi:hypothetical protein